MMRWSSVLPSSENKHNSTPVAWAEKSAKFTPWPSQYAPKGYGLPSCTEYCFVSVIVWIGLARTAKRPPFRFSAYTHGGNREIAVFSRQIHRRAGTWNTFRGFVP